MPAIRPGAIRKVSSQNSIDSTTSTRNGTKDKVEVPVGVTSDDALPPCTVEYPLDGSSRATFRTRDGRKVTEHQWAVYDFTRKIPRGRTTTYGTLCKALGKGSPRSVGSALRHNPFAPFVPCHRVIASNLYIGGFSGEWGKSLGKDGASGHKCQKKMEMLAAEGVEFTADGYLVNKNLIWKG